MKHFLIITALSCVTVGALIGCQHDRQNDNARTASGSANGTSTSITGNSDAITTDRGTYGSRNSSGTLSSSSTTDRDTRTMGGGQ